MRGLARHARPPWVQTWRCARSCIADGLGARQLGGVITASGLAAGLVLMAAAPALAQAPADGCTAGSRFPGRGPVSTAPASGIGGTDAYADGVFVHQDYVYDDHGPAGVAPGQVGDTSALASGSYRYPLDEPRFVNNAADIREVRLRLDGDAAVVEVHLQSLVEAGTTAATVAFDTDTDAATPGTLPFGLGLTADGADLAVTLGPAQAQLSALGRDEHSPVPGTVDVDSNVLTVRIPRALLPASGRLRTWAAAGLWDEAAGSYAQVLPAPTTTSPGGRQLPGDVRAFDVAFHPGEGGPDQWFDRLQAEALAAGDISALVGSVDLDLVRSGADVPWEPRPGYYEGIHRSAFTLPPYGEGWSLTAKDGSDDSSVASFMNEYQPYSLYLPPQVERGEPLALTVFFHGGTRNHTNLIGAENMQTQLGDALGSVLVAPLARRGNEIDYDDDRLADSREVLADVHRRLDIDPDRRWLTGYSQGGNGVYRFMTFMADEWAAATIWAGQNPGAEPWLDSARWVPTLLPHSPADELVFYGEALSAHQRLDELGYEHELRTHGGEHEYQAVTDDYRQQEEWFGARTRDPNPPRVTYARVPAEDEPDYGLLFDSSYYLSHISTPADRGVVDVISHGLGKSEPAVEEVLAPETGPPGPYLRDGLAYVDQGPVPARNAATVELDAIDAVTIDAVRAALDLETPLELTVTTDGPTALTLAGLPGTAALSGDGSVAPGPCGPVVRYDGAGTFSTVLTARPGSASGGTPGRAGQPGEGNDRLPSTGGGGTAPAVLVLAFAAALRWRRP